MQIGLNGGDIWGFYTWFMTHLILVTTEASRVLQVKPHQVSMIISHRLDIFPHCFKDLTQYDNGEIWDTTYRFFLFPFRSGLLRIWCTVHCKKNTTPIDYWTVRHLLEATIKYIKKDHYAEVETKCHFEESTLNISFKINVYILY